jgi:hypothetical protein
MSLKTTKTEEDLDLIPVEKLSLKDVLGSVFPVIVDKVIINSSPECPFLQNLFCIRF